MQTLITVLNVNKKFSQTDKFSCPWFSQNRRQNFGSGAAEKKLYVANRGIDVVIIGVAQQR